MHRHSSLKLIAIVFASAAVGTAVATREVAAAGPPSEHAKDRRYDNGGDDWFPPGGGGTRIRRVVINPRGVEGRPGVYSAAIKVGNTIYLAGQVGLDSRKRLVPGFSNQVRVAFHRIKKVLRYAGASLYDVVKVTVFLTDIADYSIMNEIYKDTFRGLDPPARSTVAVAALPLGAQIEIECTAVISDDDGGPQSPWQK